FGTKRWVETTLNEVDTGRSVQVGGMGKAPCFGDSGGPAFVQLADGSWRVFGIDSSGLSGDCRDGDRMALIHPAVPWIEKTSGIDITPCHDADGTWHPSRWCRSFSMAPGSPGRTWTNGCAESGMSGPEETCGSAASFDPSDDAGAPPDDPPLGPLDPNDSHSTIHIEPDRLGCSFSLSRAGARGGVAALLLGALLGASATRRSKRRSSGSAARDR